MNEILILSGFVLLSIYAFVLIRYVRACEDKDAELSRLKEEQKYETDKFWGEEEVITYGDKMLKDMDMIKDGQCQMCGHSVPEGHNCWDGRHASDMIYITEEDKK